MLNYQITRWFRFFCAMLRGVVTFELPYESHRGTMEGHFLAPRVAALFADLAPQEGGGIYLEVINGTSASWMIATTMFFFLGGTKHI